MRRWVETWLARPTEWIREFLPETGWCISEWAICDFFNEEMVGGREMVTTPFTIHHDGGDHDWSLYTKLTKVVVWWNLHACLTSEWIVYWQGTQVRLVTQVRPDLKERLEQRDLLDSLETLVCLDRLEQLASPVLVELQVLFKQLLLHSLRYFTVQSEIQFNKCVRKTHISAIWGKQLKQHLIAFQANIPVDGCMPVY